MIHQHLSKLKLLIVDDHEFTRIGLSYDLQKKAFFESIREAENGQQAIKLVSTFHPDVILMDIGMPQMNGIEATRLIKKEFPKIRILMFTVSHSTEDIYASLAAGVDAYCLKDNTTKRLINIIQEVMEGALWLDPKIARVVVNALPSPQNKTIPTKRVGESLTEGMRARPDYFRRSYNTELTDRELEVLSMIAVGSSNKEISANLMISIHTVKAHVKNIIQKMAVESRTQAAVKALQDGLIEKKSNKPHHCGYLSNRLIL